MKHLPEGFTVVPENATEALSDVTGGHPVPALAVQRMTSGRGHTVHVGHHPSHTRLRPSDPVLTLCVDGRYEKKTMILMARHVYPSSDGHAFRNRC